MLYRLFNSICLGRAVRCYMYWPWAFDKSCYSHMASTAGGCSLHAVRTVSTTSGCSFLCGKVQLFVNRTFCSLFKGCLC